MHEHGLITDLFRKMDKVAHTHGSDRIRAVEIWIGALAHISESHFREHFDHMSPGTVAEGAALTIVMSDDPYHPQAQQLILQSVALDVPEDDATKP